MNARFLGVLLGLLLGACMPHPRSGNATVPGDANIHVTTTALPETEYQSGRDGSLGLTQATPRGDFLASMATNQDAPTDGHPPLNLRIQVASINVREGDRVDFPLVTGLQDADLRVTVVYDGITYSSDRPGPTGMMYMERLRVAPNGAVDFRANFNLTLSSDGDQKLTLNGYLAAQQGSPANVDITTP